MRRFFDASHNKYYPADFLIDEPNERKGIIVLEKDTNPFSTMVASFEEGWFNDLLPKKAYKILKAEEKPERVEVKLLELTGKKSLRKIKNRLKLWFEYEKEFADFNDYAYNALAY